MKPIPATLYALPLLVAAGPLLAQGAAPATVAAEASLPYTVKASDKLIVLSKELLVRPADWNEVARFNRMKDPNFIRPGQTLQIPLRLMKHTPVAGRLVSAEGSVQLGGTPAMAGAPVPEGARLQTGANSSAVVEMADGSRVKLLPNSLAEVAAQRHYAMRDASASGSTNWFSGLVRLAQGTLDTLAAKTAQRAEPLRIETPTSLVGVRGTSFRVAYEDPAARNSRAEVIEGAVRADNPSQQSGAELPGGTGAVVDPAKQEVAVVKLLPPPDMAPLSGEVFRPQGAWALPTVPGASAYRVQVAADAGFDRIVRDLKVAAGSVDLGTLPLGNWFARVRGIDGQGLEGFDGVKPLSVREEIRMQPASSGMRVSGSVTTLFFTPSMAGGEGVSAPSWSAVVATDRALTRVVASPTSAKPEFALDGLAPGRYFIRIKAVPAAGNARETDVLAFELPGNWGSTVFELIGPLQPAQ
ncbi:MAG: FecR domain-containing protein [Burkholderiaceae bacterium]